MSDSSEVEIRSLPKEVSSEQAKERATDRLLTRVKNLVTARDVVRTELRYKPFYSFEATLRKEYFRKEDKVYEGVILVDPMTGISRVILEEHIELETRTVPESSMLPVELDEEEALQEANSQRMQTEQKEGGKIELADQPEVVYKPVWILEHDDDTVQVVDGTDGRVVDDFVLG